MTAQTEAQLIADALDDEFAQGRISNHTGRKAAAELRRLESANAELLEVLVECIEDANGYESRSGKMLVGGWPGKARAAIAKHGGIA